MNAVLLWLMVLPWLNPFALGPTSNVIPLLVSYVCAVGIGIALLLRAPTQPHTQDAFARTIAIGWLVAASASCLIGLLQYFGVSAHFRPWINVTALGEAFANLRQRNQFATLANIGLTVLLFGAWLSARRVAHSGGDQAGQQLFTWPRTALFALAALMGAANAATLSRTGLIELLALGLLATLWRTAGERHVLAVWVFAAACYAGAAVALPALIGLDPMTAGIGSRLLDGEKTCASRWLLWQNVWHLIQLRPWLGWGWGELDFAHFITLYPQGRFCDILDNAHNLPLHLAVELGVPIATAFCITVVWCVVCLRPWREVDPWRQVAWAVLMLIGLHSLLEYPLWYGPFQLAVALSVWILWRTSAQTVGVEQSVVQGRDAQMVSIRALAGACAIFVLVAVAYAAWDYRRISQIYLSPAKRATFYRENTLEKVQDSWLFHNQVQFAALTLTAVTPANAVSINRSAHALLHFSPEARVVEKLIDSAMLLGRTEEAVFFMRRFRNAYPKDYLHWRETRDAITELPPVDP